jgi:hypothetical protein
MLDEAFDRSTNQTRVIKVAQEQDDGLGPFKLLPGTWKNVDTLPFRGWNMIALPFAQPGSRRNFRLLVNKYAETLRFKVVDKGIPNRGIQFGGPGADSTNTDQTLVALDYEQMIEQELAADEPPTPLAGPPELAIHHEPGLFLHMTNETTAGIDIARLATIPHGDSVLGLGRSDIFDGPPDIPQISGLPLGVPADLDPDPESPELDNPYVQPYKHFHENLFDGIYDPTIPNDLLIKAAAGGGAVARTTQLSFDTTLEDAGIVNIPFIVKQANAAQMKATFWILELEEKDANGDPKLRLLYSQVVILDFFPRRDGFPGLIRWPHVSINTLEKVPEPPAEYTQPLLSKSS